MLLVVAILSSKSFADSLDSNLNYFNSPVIQQIESQKKSKTFKVTFRDSWFTEDKADHLLSCTFLTVSSYYYCKKDQNLSHNKSITFSTSFVISLGLAKEIRDGFKKRNAASIKDFAANLIGIGIGYLLFNLEK